MLISEGAQITIDLGSLIAVIAFVFSSGILYAQIHRARNDINNLWQRQRETDAEIKELWKK